MTNVQYGFSNQPEFLQQLVTGNSEFKSLFVAPALAIMPPTTVPSSSVFIPASTAVRARPSTGSTRRVPQQQPQPQPQPALQSSRAIEVEQFGNFLQSLLQIQ